VNTRVVVVDASVVLKWVVTEPGSDAASVLLSDSAAGAVSLVAPEHVIGEVANGLRKRVVQGVLTASDALAALDAIADLELDFLTGSDRWFGCLHAALDWAVTTYDALYIQVAIDLNAELITADKRLLDSAQRRSLPVRSLSHLESS
jgi:predicted nucleic acid-binding protein